MTQAFRIVEAAMDRREDQHAVITLVAAYALDEMGNGGPLPEAVLKRLVPGLRAHPTTLVLLAFSSDVPVGIATCSSAFRRFSRFH